MARALKVVIRDSSSGKLREERYARSPVRIGRNPRNDLCLSFSFVSGRHAQVDFDDKGGTFKDVGSTNGSTVNGHRLAANQPVPIGDGINITIGKLEMRLGWIEATSSSYKRDPQGAVVTRAPRQPTMPIQAVPELQGGPQSAPTGPPPMHNAPPPGPPPMMGGGVGGPPPMMGPGAGGPPPMMGAGAGGPPPLMGQGAGGPPPLMGGGGPPPSLDSGPPLLGGQSGPPSISPGNAPGNYGGPPPMMGGHAGPPSLDAPQPKKRMSGAEATGFVDLGGVHRAIRSLKPAYAQYEVARQQFEVAVEEALGQIPANTRDTAMAFLRREFPNMPGASVFKAAPVAAQGVPEASSTVTNFAAHVLGTVSPPGNADEQAAFLARIADVLQTTAQAFIEIRNVQARFGEEMGVRTIREFTQLHAANDARAVLDYLLDWRNGGPERNGQLSAVYSDFMLHQVALINGVVEGVQAMMDQFRPAEIERGVGGLSKSAGAWKKYTERYTEEIEERGISSLVFGPEFARAYAEVGKG